MTAFRRTPHTAPLLLAALTATVLGCGGGSHAAREPTIAAETTVSSSDPLGDRAVREVVRIRQAGAAAAELYRRIVGVIESAAQQPPEEGGPILRAELLPLLEEAGSVWSRSARAIAAETPVSELGRGQRAILLRAATSEQVSLARLRRELGEGTSPWAAVGRFGKRTNDLHGKLGAELDDLMAAIPAHERDALRRAVVESG